MGPTRLEQDHARGGAAAALVPIADPLSRIGQELGDLTALVDEVQSAVSRVIDGVAAEGGSSTLGSLQKLDFLRQHVDQIAAFANALSLAASRDWLLDVGPALRAVLVSDLAARLHPSHAGQPAAGHGPQGDCEFF